MSAPVHDDQDFDLEVLVGLLGDSEEREAAVRRLFNRYGRPLMAYLRKKLPSLPAEDVASAVNDTFVAIFRKAEDGSLDVERPLKSLLFTIAKRRGVDLMRAKASRIPLDDQITEEIGSTLEGTAIGNAWSAACETEKVAEIVEEFRRFVGTLPPQQKRVGSILADFLPDWLTDTEISDEIYRRWSQRVPVVSVKGAKQALKEKFREVLKRKGLLK